MFVYETTNLMNGMKYIGLTTTSEDGLYFGSGKEIRKAIKEFGKENFSRVILQRCSGLAELTITEINWIRKVDAVASSDYYNLSSGGNHNPNIGKPRTDETRKKISESHKGKKLSESTKKKLSNFRKGKTHSKETKQKISTALMGQNNPFYGMKHNEQTIQKLREKSIKQHQLNPKPKGENNTQSKIIVCIHPSGKEEIFVGIREMCRKLQLHRTSVMMVIKNQYSHHHGFKFRFR